MKKYTIEIDHDLRDKILIDTLQEDYKMILESVRRLEARAELKSHEQEDLRADKKYLKAHKRVIRYHMVKQDFDQFIAEVGK